MVGVATDQTVSDPTSIKTHPVERNEFESNNEAMTVKTQIDLNPENTADHTIGAVHVPKRKPYSHKLPPSIATYATYFS